jgi:hypothetical protein
MPITTSDVLFKGSGGTGTGNSTAVANPNNWLGGYMSSTEITNASLHNVFDVITGDENAASDVEYRCIFVHNAHATLTYQSVVVWISSETAGGASAALSLDTTGVVAYNTASTMAKTIANEGTAPATQTFSAPTTKGTGLSVGNMGPNTAQAIWIRRTAANTGALDLDGVVISVSGDSAA